MKIHSLIVTTFALTLSFGIAQENEATPTVQITEKSGVDPFKIITSTSEPSPAALQVLLLSESLDGKVVLPPPQAPAVAENTTSRKRQRPTQVMVSPAESQLPGHEVLSFCYEDFSLPMEMMADIQKKQMNDRALYEYIQKNLGSDPEKDPVRREIFVILRAKAGFEATTENYTPFIVPHSQRPDRIGYCLNVEYDAEKEISLRFGLNNRVVTSNSNEMLEGKEVNKPLIGNETIRATVALTLGNPSLVGTVNRAADSKEGSASGKRILLGFVTASEVK